LEIEREAVGPITAPRKRKNQVKKLVLLIGLMVPWTAFAQDITTFYDGYGRVIGSAQQDGVGNWHFSDSLGRDTGSAIATGIGGWTFYDRLGNPVGSQNGK
jgi:hypothetical protein